MKKFTIKELELYHPDMVKDQKLKPGGVRAKYEYECKEHGVYLQSSDNHQQGHGCPKCGHAKIGDRSRLTIDEMERRHPDMVKGQQWHGNWFKYNYECKKHGVYLQSFTNHNRGCGCPQCGHFETTKKTATAGRLSRTPEYSTVTSHFRRICTSTKPKDRNYKGMPFFDDWNPHKGGSFFAGREWIIKNLGMRPVGCSLHIIDHMKGFVPGNLEWTYPQKQSAQQMFKIIAELRHQVLELEKRNRELELQAIEVSRAAYV